VSQPTLPTGEPVPVEDTVFPAEMQWLAVESMSLKNALQGLTVADASNQERPVSVYFGMPDPEIQQQNYPFITIDLIDIAVDRPRLMSGYYPYQYSVPGTPTPPDGYVNSFQPHSLLPMLLTFQIGSWARQAWHDYEIISELSHKTLNPWFGQVAAIDNTDRRLTVSRFTKMSTTTQGRRLYRSIWTVNMTSELFTTEFALTKLVDQVIINPAGVAYEGPSTIAQLPTIEYP
jgi:hypothetical protein